MLDRTLSHYRIESRLGEGSMGAVYLARDLALGRSAALEVVANNVDSDLRDRLLREAEASARLQHPAIATFYESSEADGQAFIAMEYVRGRTLRELLDGGALPPETAIAIASAVLEALNHAHAAGILHRDIKPENIMVTADGAPKLLDFGLAKALSGSGRETDATVQNLTGGRILGTVGYMSPEQLRGEELEPASDLFAIGAVLYEMAAGRAAFPGAHATERIAAILTREPAPLEGPAKAGRYGMPGFPLQGPTFPPALWPIIQRALAKDRNARYSSASAMLSDLRAMAEGGTVPSSSPLPQTLAVIDFRNLSRQSDDDWIGSGIAESVSADLARVPGLTVVGREKMLATARARRNSAGGDQAKDALALGSILGCRWILVGTLPGGTSEFESQAAHAGSRRCAHPGSAGIRVLRTRAPSVAAPRERYLRPGAGVVRKGNQPGAPLRPRAVRARRSARADCTSSGTGLTSRLCGRATRQRRSWNWRRQREHFHFPLATS